MPATRKNELVKVSVSISADPRLAAALQTEVETSEIQSGFQFEIHADSISDARARMNTVLRSLIAAHRTGQAIGAWV